MNNYLNIIYFSLYATNSLYDKGSATLEESKQLWQTLPCWPKEKCVYVKFLESPPLFIPLTDSYWPSTHPFIMREFLNIRGCLTHILAPNQTPSAHLCHRSCSRDSYGGVTGGFVAALKRALVESEILKSSTFVIESGAGNSAES